MKKIIFLFIGFMFFFAACKKDEKQIQRTWTIDNVSIGGADHTAEYKLNHYTETYADGGNYSFTGDPQNNSGAGKYTWDGKSVIKRNGVSNQASMDLEVLKLTRKEFQYKTSINSEEAVFKFVK